MARNIEELIKLENTRDITEFETIEVFPTMPNLDLLDIETQTEPATICHIELGLDQLEERED